MSKEARICFAGGKIPYANIREDETAPYRMARFRVKRKCLFKQYENTIEIATLNRSDALELLNLWNGQGNWMYVLLD